MTDKYLQGPVVSVEQYNRWIKNMNKNKSGTSWVWLIHQHTPYGDVGYTEEKRLKLYKDDENHLYFINSYNFDSREYLKMEIDD